MTMNAICIVKGIKLQNPSPNDTAAVSGLAPNAIAAMATMITAIAAKIYASGNHRSAQAERRNAVRTSQDDWEDGVVFSVTH